MNCPNCGIQIENGTLFCPNCGAKVTETEAPPPAGDPSGRNEYRGAFRCPNCGAPAPFGATVCQGCGMPFTAANDPSKAPGNPVPPFAGQPPVPPPFNRPVEPPRSRLIAAFLALFFGTFALDEFYLGDKTIAIVRCVLSLISGGFIGMIWGFVNAYRLLTYKVNTDSDGRALKDLPF